MSFSPLIRQLIDALRTLPGVGQKTAQRMALRVAAFSIHQFHGHAQFPQAHGQWCLRSPQHVAVLRVAQHENAQPRMESARPEVIDGLV